MVFLWGPLVGGEVLSPAAMLYDLVPWRPYAPPDLGAYSNPTLIDAAVDFYPWLRYARESLHAGIPPLWNPFALSGTPFIANAQTALFSPFNLPFWTVSFNYAFGLSAALKLWVAAFGAYLLTRELQAGFFPGLLAGLSFAFCAFNVVWLSHPHVNVSVMLPVALWSAERTIRRGRGSDGLLVALLSAIAFLGGHPGTQLHLLAALGIYATVRLAAMPRLSGRKRLQRSAILALGVGLAVVLAAVALLPAALLVPESTGMAQRSGGGKTLPLQSVGTALFPDWWGRPSAVDLGGPINFNERTMYVGAVALLLAGVGLISAGGWATKLPLLALALVGLEVPLGLPPLDWAYSRLPVFGNALNARLILLFQLAVAVLAAMGLQRLFDGRPTGRHAWVILATVAVPAIAAVTKLGPSLHELRMTANHFLTGADYPSMPTVISLTSVVWWTALGTALTAAIWLRRRAGAWVAASVIVALAAVDLAHFAHGYQPSAPPSKVFPPTPPSISFLKRHDAGERIVAVGPGFALLPDSAMRYELRDIRGHDPPQPDRRYARLLAAATVNTRPSQAGIRTASPIGLEIPVLTSAGRHVLNVLGARWVLQPPELPPPRMRALTRSYDGRDATIYRNAHAAPRALVPRRVTQAADADHALRLVLIGARSGPASGLDRRRRRGVQAVKLSGFDPRRQAIVEGVWPRVRTGAGSVRVVGDQNSEVELRVDLQRGGLVVLNDVLKEGWSVDVDGRPAQPLRVNTVFRGVEVPAGAHSVRWRYRVPGLHLGMAITALGMAVAVAWGGWLALHRGGAFSWSRRHVTE